MGERYAPEHCLEVGDFIRIVEPSGEETNAGVVYDFDGPWVIFKQDSDGEKRRALITRAQTEWGEDACS